jgi:hypothetical protein
LLIVSARPDADPWGGLDTPFRILIDVVISAVAVAVRVVGI